MADEVNLHGDMNVGGALFEEPGDELCATVIEPMKIPEEAISENIF